ncbi:MAG TPA: sulfite exporter TauE/SafE family protein [Brachybacterium sp.]|nr:sulfite exporter TauE/SafE family protein [Brachybacterium sp.]
MLIGALVIGVLVGSLTGLLGAGGAIIALPLLVYALGIPMADAVPMMLAVGVLSPISALLPRLRTDVDWRSVAAVGAAGILGAYSGTAAGAHLPDRLTLAVFALLMIVAGVRMLRRGGPTEEPAPELGLAERVLRGLGVGLLAGFLTGLLGLGGGFIVIPLLMLALHLPFKRAVGTSLAVTVVNAAAGLVSHWGTAQLDWGLTATFAIATVGAAFLAARLATRVPAEPLQRAFAILILGLAAFTLAQSILA